MTFGDCIKKTSLERSMRIGKRSSSTRLAWSAGRRWNRFSPSRARVARPQRPFVRCTRPKVTRNACYASLEFRSRLPNDVALRLSTLETALRTAEGPLGDTRRAFDYALRGLQEAASESGVQVWIDTVERLSAATGRWNQTCSLYQKINDNILDGEVQQAVRLRVGELAWKKLSDSSLAIVEYKKALEAHGEDRRAMVALEQLYAEAGDSGELLAILKLRVDNAENDEEKKALLFREAELQKTRLGDVAGAITTYEAILDVDLDPSALTALDLLYRESGRYEDLIALYQRQLDGGVGRAADLRVNIAQIARHYTRDIERAFDELGEALEGDAGHEGAVGELEHLLEEATDPEHRARAGAMLEPVYLRRADWSKVKTALAARLAASHDPAERRDLLTRLATLHEEQLEDYGAALETVALLLHEDLTDESIGASSSGSQRWQLRKGALLRCMQVSFRRSLRTTRPAPSSADGPARSTPS